MAVLAPERTDDETPPSPRRRVPRRPARQLTPPLPTDRWLSWVLAAVLGAVTFISRIWNIGYPPDLLFDEAYYPPEANEIVEWGYEFNRGYTFIVTRHWARS